MRSSIILSLLLVVALSSCTWKNMPGNTSNSGSTSLSNGVQFVAPGDTVKVDYTGRFEDGTIFDSSRKEDAMKWADYNSGRTYEPLEFVVGAGQMIPGFDKGIQGMKVGEKKELRISPKDAYGEKTMEQTIPREVIESKFTRTIDKEQFSDVITRTVPTSMLGEKGNNVKKGEKISANGTDATVVDVASGSVTLAIENKQNPFYGKELKAGLQTEVEKNIITIKSLSASGVTVEVENKSSPFYGKELKMDLEAPLPQAGTGSFIKIVNLTSTGVVVSIPNPHPLAGKTLIFDLEVKSVKTSETSTGTVQ